MMKLELERKTEAVRHYLRMREQQPLQGLGDTIHAIHTGTEYAAELRLSDLRAAIEGVAQPTRDWKERALRAEAELSEVNGKMFAELQRSSVVTEDADLLGEMKHGHAEPVADRHYAWAVAEITQLRQKVSKLIDEASFADLRASGGIEHLPQEARKPYPDPTPEMLDGDPLFDAIWSAIKGWDISRHNDGMYSGPTGNDARHIYDAIKGAGA
jgi:hypothetical protein